MIMTDTKKHTADSDMAEEKTLDMAGVAEDAAEAERVAEEARQERESSEMLAYRP